MSLHAPARVRTRLGAVASAVCVVAALGLTGTPAHAASTATPTFTDDDVSTTPTTITTSTGKKLSLIVDVDVDPPSDCPDCGNEATDVEVELATPDGTEEHDWDGNGPSSDYTPPSGTTPGVIASNNDLGTQGAIDLTVTPVGEPTTHMCSGKVGSVTQKATVSGTFFFDTRSSGVHAWGAIGSSATPITFTESATLDSSTDDDCSFDQFLNGCQFRSTWFVGGANHLVFGETGTKNTPFQFVHFASLANDVDRTDTYSGELASAAITKSGTHAKVRIAGNHKLTSGSGTLTTTLKHSVKSTCGAKHTKVTDKDYEGTFKNGSKPFTVHPQVFGNVSLKSGSKGAIDSMVKR